MDLFLAALFAFLTAPCWVAVTIGGNLALQGCIGAIACSCLSLRRLASALGVGPKVGTRL
jgi:hypothetical protein